MDEQGTEDVQRNEEQEPERRFFSRSERIALQAAAGGRCEECGADLAAGFHADHRLPFAAGGRTSLDNAQALCPECNRRKGARIVDVESVAGGTAPAAFPAIPSPANASPAIPSWTLPLRPWQRNGVHVWRRLREQGMSNMTVTATPGSGKTALALFLACEELRAGRADLLVVVVPTKTLKTQWAQAAHRAGLHLTAGWGTARSLPLPTPTAALSPMPRSLPSPKPCSFCALGGGSWGFWMKSITARQARPGEMLFTRRSKTRSPACAYPARPGAPTALPFPLCGATRTGDSLSDVSYRYAQALDDGVLREAYFFALEARVLWLDERGERTATFADALGERDGARRLRAALDAQGDWLRSLLEQADAALTLARPGHPQAKGLAVAMDTLHARAVAHLLQQVTGEAPALALSDDPSSLATLERFRISPCRWLVVCKMAGEGYDLPDIRIVAWATNLTSEVAFRQIVGRALRMVPGLVHQDAQVFLPADPRLMAMARGLMGEGHLRPRLGDTLIRGEDEEGGGPGLGEGASVGGSLFVPLSSRATGQSVVTGGAVVTSWALARARAMQAASAGLSGVPAHWLAAEISRLEAEPAGLMSEEGREGETEVREDGAAAGLPAGEASAIGSASSGVVSMESDAEPLLGEAETYDRRRQHLRRICTRLTALIAQELDINVSVVHRAFRRGLGVRQAEATLAQLEQRKRLLEDKLRELRVAGFYATAMTKADP